MADEREIAAYYDRGRGAGRLGDWGRLEFLRTRELLARFLPAPPATVLDVGGAAGAYALPLAAEGYEVHLVDPVALHVEQARAASAAQPDAPLASAVVGDARALPVDDAQRRRRAPARAALPPHRGGRPQLAPCARRGARCAPAACSPPRPSRASPRPSTASPRASCSSPASRRSSSATSPTASTATPTRTRGWFTTAYFHRPDELEREVAAAGFDVTALVAVEGAVGAAAETHALDAWLDDPGRREILLRAIRRVEAEPSLLGASPHLLALATAP